MQSLRSTLEKVTQDNKRAKKLRRYIVVEAVYQVFVVNHAYGFFIQPQSLIKLTSGLAIRS